MFYVGYVCIYFYFYLFFIVDYPNVYNFKKNNN